MTFFFLSKKVLDHVHHEPTDKNTFISQFFSYLVDEKLIFHEIIFQTAFESN